MAYYLNAYLGDYLTGLDPQSLRISVLAGDVTLSNLTLKPEALNALKLPITVTAGLLGKLRLKVRASCVAREANLPTGTTCRQGLGGRSGRGVGWTGRWSRASRVF